MQTQYHWQCLPSHAKFHIQPCGADAAHFPSIFEPLLYLGNACLAKADAAWHVSRHAHPLSALQHILSHQIQQGPFSYPALRYLVSSHDMAEHGSQISFSVICCIADSIHGIAYYFSARLSRHIAPSRLLVLMKLKARRCSRFKQPQLADQKLSCDYNVSCLCQHASSKDIENLSAPLHSVLLATSLNPGKHDNETLLSKATALPGYCASGGSVMTMCVGMGNWIIMDMRSLQTPCLSVRCKDEPTYTHGK